MEALTSAQAGGYLGDASCKACHEQAFSDWQGSHHDKAMQLVDETTVLGDFNNVEISIDGVSYFFIRKKQTFMLKQLNLMDQSMIIK